MLGGIARTALLVSTLSLAAGVSDAAAQGATTDIAYVSAVSGFVLASAQGQPTPLDVLDGIRERTRLDLPANSELSICHFRTRTLLTMRGPLRAVVSANGLAVEDANAVTISAETCAAPTLANVQGGLLSRGLATRR